MNSSDARAKLANFLESLPDKVFSFLLDKKLELNILPIDIAEKYGLTLGEVGGVCEGVRRVLAGEDSAANLVSFIEKDQNIEEDNREKIPQIAYELQTKIFDVVFPIFKQAGLPLKEGRVAEPGIKYKVSSIKGQTGGGSAELLSPYAPVPSPIGPSSIRPVGPIRPTSPMTPATRTVSAPQNVSGQAPPPSSSLSAKSYQLSANHIRALTRIAAGTAYTEDALRAAFEDLPQGLRQAISSVDTANAIQDIAKQYLLHVDQMGALASETGLVLLGLTHPAAFIGNLAKRLRLPEEKAREIAREISAKILVKVRDALRGLHEENPKSEIRNPKQIINSNEQNWLNQATEPPRKLNVMPSPLPKGVPPSPPARGGALSPRSGVVGAAGRVVTTPVPTGVVDTPFTKGDLPKATTPFSPSAKWNTGENILNKQAAEKEESLNREEVLTGIENPTPAFQRPASGIQPARVGPTGWRPAASGGNIEIRNPKSETNPNPQIQKNQPPVQPQRLAPSMPPKPPLEKVRPQSEGAPPPEKSKAEPQNFLDEKLAGPAGLQREEKDYTTDPYREPLDS